MSNKIYHIDKDIKNTLIQTFSFDHNLTDNEILEIEKNISLSKDANHIYFKDKIDIENINKIRSLLETSITINDEKIEKYIIIDYQKKDLDFLLDINYLSPDTWHLIYKRTDDIKDIYTVAECRRLKKYFNNILSRYIKEELSQLEKICFTYDIIKLLDYKNEKNNLLEIIKSQTTNSYGYNLLFQELLNYIGIPSYIEKVKSDDDRFITAIEIDDDKYNVHGIYLFDPFMDSLPKDEYEETLRMINYNYFCLSFNKFHNSIYKDSLTGILKIFYNQTEKMFKDHLQELKLFDKKDLDKFKKVFDDEYINLYNKIKNSGDIEENVLFGIITSSANKNEDIINLIKKNYDLKQKEMYKE